MSFAKPKNLIEDWVTDPIKKVASAGASVVGSAGSAAGSVVGDVLAPVGQTAGQLIQDVANTGLVGEFMGRKEVAPVTPNTTNPVITMPVAPAAGGGNNMILIIGGAIVLIAVIFMMKGKK